MLGKRVEVGEALEVEEGANLDLCRCRGQGFNSSLNLNLVVVLTNELFAWSSPTRYLVVVVLGLDILKETLLG